MPKAVQIAMHRIDEGSSKFVVAEIGINHNGDLAIAKRLIDVAKEAGCNAVKFQKWNPERRLIDTARTRARACSVCFTKG